MRKRKKATCDTVFHEVRIYNAQGKLKKKITKGKVLERYQSVYRTRSEDCFNTQIQQVTRASIALSQYHKELSHCYDAYVDGCQ